MAPPSTIALLCPFRDATGNTTSARRIRRHLESDGYRVVEFSTDQPIDTTFSELCRQENVTAALGLHAVHSGKHLVSSGVPFGFIFCNTDLNRDLDNAELRPLIVRAVSEARVVSCYHNEFFARLNELFPEAADKILCIPKSVTTTPSASFSLHSHLQLPGDAALFLLPSGLRALKDPLYLVDSFSRWHSEQPACYLVIIGADRDRKYATHVRQVLRGSPGVRLCAPLSTQDFHAAISSSTAVINSSQYEGVPNALLEAMDLGVPVIARNIPGNSEFVIDGKTGLSFATPEQGIEAMSRIECDVALRDELTSNAKLFLESSYSVEKEKAGYLEMVERIQS